MQTSTLREVNQFLSQMQQEKAHGKGIVMFHICSVGQIQFMLPVGEMLPGIYAHYFIRASMGLCPSLISLNVCFAHPHRSADWFF